MPQSTDAMRHGTRNAYREDKCRCDACRSWASESMRAYRKRRHAGDFPTTSCVRDECERPATVRSLCVMHYRREMRSLGLEKSPSDSWSDVRRSNWHARRARLNGSRHSDRVLVAGLIAQGATTCQWCSHAIDLALEYPHRYSKSLDHTIPVSRGGTHTLDNVTLMHLTCNLSKGTKMPTH